MENGLFQPKDLAKLGGINKNTLKRYLADRELFPPVKVDEDSGYRYYPKETVSRLKVFKALRKKPFRLKEYEIKQIFKTHGIDTIIDLYNKSNRSLYSYLAEKESI